MPANWILQPYWSDQKYGGFAGDAVVPSTGEQRGDGDGGALQRARPMFDAVRPANTRLMPGRTVAHRDHVRDRRRPALVAYDAVGQVERAVAQPLDVGDRADSDQTTSAASRRPSANCTPVTRSLPVRSATGAPHSSRVPCSVCSRATAAPSCTPSGPARGASAASTTVTSRPNFDAVEATSPPMNPAPITTSRAPGRSSRRRAMASSTVRSTCTPARRAEAGHEPCPRTGGHDDAVGADRGSVVEVYRRPRPRRGGSRARRAATARSGHRRRLPGPRHPRRRRRQGTPSTAGDGRKAAAPRRRRSSARRRNPAHATRGPPTDPPATHLSPQRFSLCRLAGRARW